METAFYSEGDTEGKEEKLKTEGASSPKISLLNSSSVKILTPSSTAFLYFDPGFSPTTKKAVLGDTLELTIAPKDYASACAVFLSIFNRVPVKTTIFPLRGELLV